MKNIILFMAVGLIAFSCNCGSSSNKNQEKEQENKNTSIAKANQVQAYYFHFSRRCKTCQSVEEVTKKVLNELYGNAVTLQSINLDEEGEANELAEKMDVKAQTLLIVVDGKKHDLTNAAFLNAVNAPETLKEKIVEAVKS